jgi:hypothetical protein
MRELSHFHATFTVNSDYLLAYFILFVFAALTEGLRYSDGYVP